MKKILCFILVLIMLASLISCQSADGNGNDTADTDKNAETSASDTEAETEPEYEYDGIFKVGYGRVDITPTEPVPLNTGDILTKVQEPIFATCVAVNDGTNTVLLFTLDIKNISAEQDKELRSIVSTYTKVPQKNMVFNAMHNHSAPTPGIPAGNSALYRWTQFFRKSAVEAAKLAIEDLSDATMYAGTAKTTNFAFVRRYIHQDGSFSSIHMRNKSTTPIVGHESDADDTAQIIRFVREDKKDVLITNWQAHVAHAIGMYPESISGDFVYHFREDIELKDDDALVAFYCGASGNINLTVKVLKLNVCSSNYKKVGSRLADVVLEQQDNLQKIQPGKIEMLAKNYKADIREVSADRVADAQTVASSAAEGTDEYNKLLDKYGFNSKYEVNRLISLGKSQGKTSDLMIRTIAFGDLAFVTVPYEMFDTNGMEVKEASPYKMTFVLGTTGGSFGYVPSALAVPNGGYEVYQSSFRYGTAEEVVAELVKMLNSMYK